MLFSCILHHNKDLGAAAKREKDEQGSTLVLDTMFSSPRYKTKGYLRLRSILVLPRENLILYPVYLGFVYFY